MTLLQRENHTIFVSSYAVLSFHPFAWNLDIFSL